MHGRLSDQNGDFVYACYVKSPTLNATARPGRSSFELADDAGELFRSTDVGFDDIRRVVRDAASAHLADQINDARQRTTERVSNYANYTSPRYRPVLNRISIDDLGLDPHVSDKELELALHRQLAEIEHQMIAQGHDLLAPQSAETAESYTQRVAEYLKTVADIKKSDLANYVTHRRVVLELLKEAIKRKSDGNYQREDLIHTLIMPMVKDSTEVMLDNCNLWLVHERLAFQGASHGWRFGSGTHVAHPQLAARDLGRADRRTRPSSGVLTFRDANGRTGGRLRRCDSVSGTASKAGADLARQTASGPEEKRGPRTVRTMTVKLKRR